MKFLFLGLWETRVPLQKGMRTVLPEGLPVLVSDPSGNYPLACGLSPLRTALPPCSFNWSEVRGKLVGNWREHDGNMAGSTRQVLLQHLECTCVVI